jgi:hypothetical protein
MSLINEQAPETAAPVTEAPVTTAPAAVEAPKGIELPQDWYNALPEDIRDEPSLKLIGDLPSLAKSYVHAQKAIGANKVVLPTEHATDQDWKEFFHKVGLPKDSAEYKIKFEDKENLVKPEFVDKFKEQAFKTGVLPKQAQALLDWFVGENSSQFANIKKAGETAQAEARASLVKEFGDGYERQLSAAGMVLKEFGAGPDFDKFLDESGFGDDPRVIKLFAKIGMQLFEDKIPVGGGKPGFGVTPAEAQAKINAIMGNTEHPYWNKNHANYGIAVKEMQDLYNAAYTAEQ